MLAGQGTVGLELAEDAPHLTDVLVSIGGGALIAGAAVALKAALPDVRVWGVETEGADAMARALAAGEPVAIAPSSIASTLSAPHVAELTLEHARQLVEEVFVVSDADAMRGVIGFAEEAKLWVEPATGCLVPAARQVIERVDDDACRSGSSSAAATSPTATCARGSTGCCDGRSRARTGDLLLVRQAL